MQASKSDKFGYESANKVLKVDEMIKKQHQLELEIRIGSIEDKAKSDLQQKDEIILSLTTQLISYQEMLGGSASVELEEMQVIGNCFTALDDSL